MYIKLAGASCNSEAREKGLENQLTWKLPDSVEIIVQLRLRDELIANRTLSTMVGVGLRK